MGYIGICVAGMAMGFMMAVNAYEDEINVGYSSAKLVKQCESTLPRNIDCEIVAQVKSEVK